MVQFYVNVPVDTALRDALFPRKLMLNFHFNNVIFGGIMWHYVHSLGPQSTMLTGQSTCLIVTWHGCKHECCTVNVILQLRY